MDEVSHPSKKQKTSTDISQSTVKPRSSSHPQQLSAQKSGSALPAMTSTAASTATPITTNLSSEEKEQLIQRLHMELDQRKTNESKLKHQLTELKKRESALVLRLSTKEQEMHELQSLVSDLKQNVNVSHIAQMKQALLDPAVNSMFVKLKEELEQTQKRLKQTQEELEATQFTSQSLTGRKLLAKCRLLQEENEEFGQQLSEHKVHRLENELAVQRECNEELKKGLIEAQQFVTQLDEEVDGLHIEVANLREQLGWKRDNSVKLRDKEKDRNKGKDREMDKDREMKDRENDKEQCEREKDKSKGREKDCELQWDKEKDGEYERDKEYCL